MRLVVAAALVALAACFPRPERADGPTFAWDTVGRASAPAARVPRSSGVPSAAGTWLGTLRVGAVTRTATLSLVPGGQATLVFAPAVAGAPDSLVGSWAREATWVSLELARADSLRLRDAFEFDMVGDTLVPATAWPRERFGADGPPRFTRQ